MDAEAIASQPSAGESRRLWASHETPGAYEMRPCPGMPWTRLDAAALGVYFSALAPGNQEQSGPDMAALAIRDKFNVWRDSAIQPTVAGYALFGVHPEALRPAWRVTALRLDGAGITAPVVDRLDTEGPAPRAIEQVEGFLRRHVSIERLPVDPGAGPGEQAAPEYPLAAALEAITNAVAHRDYAAPSKVFVRLYDDRLEIESPGGLLSGVTLEWLLADGESRPRNPVIAGALRRMGLMAPVGRGLVLIRQETARLGSPPPEFAADTQCFRVTLRTRRR
jgi:predicted HTH transcriptional regulator